MLKRLSHLCSVMLVTLFAVSASATPLRGVNQLHWDSPGAAKGIPLSGANAVRLAVDFNQPAAANLARAQVFSAQGITPIPGSWAGTCKSDPAILTAIVDTWVAQAPTWTQLNGPINIANEWGPIFYTQEQVSPWRKLPNYGWRDGYITAVQRMRVAGYKQTLVIDAGGCGQDSVTVTRDGAAVVAADPLHNVLFDVHVYAGQGGVYETAAGLATVFDTLKATGFPILIGEFGPGRNIGPSPTPLNPVDLVSAAESHGFGWLAWAWDDNNLGNCQSNDAWFSMTINCGKYTGLDSELTTFGKAMITLLKQYSAKPVAPAAAPAGPVYASPAALWCQPNYSCSMTLSATSPAGAVKFALTGNDARISMSSTGLLAWWTSPVAGTYPMTLVLTDTKGNTTKAPVTLTVSWVKPA